MSSRMPISARLNPCESRSRWPRQYPGCAGAGQHLVRQQRIQSFDRLRRRRIHRLASSAQRACPEAWLCVDGGAQCLSYQAFHPVGHLLVPPAFQTAGSSVAADNSSRRLRHLTVTFACQCATARVEIRSCPAKGSSKFMTYTGSIPKGPKTLSVSTTWSTPRCLAIAVAPALRYILPLEGYCERRASPCLRPSCRGWGAGPPMSALSTPPREMRRASTSLNIRSRRKGGLSSYLSSISNRLISVSLRFSREANRRLCGDSPQ